MSKANQSPWATLDKLVAAEKEPTGPEWFTLHEYQSRYKMSRIQARCRMDALVLAGKARKWTGTGMSKECGYKRLISKYRLTP